MRFSSLLENEGYPGDTGALGETLFSRMFVNLTGTCVERLLHERPSRSQWPQRGHFSSHFFFRATHVRHPVLDFSLVAWAIVEIEGVAGPASLSVRLELVWCSRVTDTAEGVQYARLNAIAKKTASQSYV